MTIAPPQEPQGRTHGSGLAVVRDSRYTPWTLLLLAALVAVGLLVGDHFHHGKPSNTFGGYPSFLPKATVDGSTLHKTVDASVASPALASQGDTVRVSVGSGTVLANVTGPEVPNEGLPYYQSPDSPAQWTVTLSNATGKVPLAVSQFTSSDDEGKIYHPVLVPGQRALPSVVPAGQTLTFKISTVMRTGEGLLRWDPVAGPKFPVAWDFVVEDD